jgi:myo-inositol 2-dehydrogenase/D-chiro-inositol 1-dehydrogenase
MTIRYGVIGTGMMGCEHIRNIVQIDSASVVAIADPNEKSRSWGVKACQGKFSPTVYTDYKDLLANDEVDAVVVASPNFTHIDVMKDIFSTHKHVLLEKPMCTTVADSNELKAMASSHQGIVWVGLEYRYMTPIMRFLEELSDDSIGDIKMFFIREHRFPFLKKVGDWNRFNRNSGGTLVEKCCHFFDMMNLVVKSKPIRVFASGAQDVNHLDELYNGEVPDILDNAFVIVDYENGARACLDLCMFAEGGRNEQELVATGSKGKLEVTIPEGLMTRAGREYGQFTSEVIGLDPRVKEVGLHHGASYLEHLDFIHCIANQLPPKVTVEDGLLSVAMGVAAQESIQQGVPIHLADLL